MKSRGQERSVILECLLSNNPTVLQKSVLHKRNIAFLIINLSVYQIQAGGLSHSFDRPVIPGQVSRSTAYHRAILIMNPQHILNLNLRFYYKWGLVMPVSFDVDPRVPALRKYNNIKLSSEAINRHAKIIIDYSFK